MKIYGNFANRLNGIDVQRNAALATRSRERAELLNDTRLIVGEDDRDQPQVVKSSQLRIPVFATWLRRCFPLRKGG